MKIYIWEGNGISDAYHNDGTLVVLASNVEEARQLMKDLRAERDRKEAEWDKKRDKLIARIGNSPNGESWTQHPEGKKLWDKRYQSEIEIWDGELSSIERKPDRILDVDAPKWVAFNGGGYD